MAFNFKNFMLGKGGVAAVSAMRKKSTTPNSPFTVQSGAKPPASGATYSLPTTPPSIGAKTGSTTPFGTKSSPTQSLQKAGMSIIQPLSSSPATVAKTAMQSSAKALAGTPTSKPASTNSNYDPAAAMLAMESANIQSGNKAQAVSDSSAYTQKPMASQMKPSAPSVETPPVASAIPKQNGVIDGLRSKVASLSGPSAEEKALSDQLAQFRGDSAKAIAGLEGQGRGISTDLIRGQQGLLQEQNQLSEQTLMDRLAAASSARQLELQAAQGEYETAQAEQTRQDALTAPQQVGNSILQYDPATGQYKTLYSAPDSGSDLPASAQEYEYAKSQGYPGSFMDYQNQGSSSSGGYTLGNTRYDANNNIVAQAPTETDLKNQQADITAQQNAQFALGKVNDLIGTRGIQQAVGLTGSLANIPGSAGANYRAQIESLKAALTLPALQSMKGMGALSDADVRLLNNSVTALSTKMSVKDFNAELQKIKTTLESKAGVAQNAGGTPSDWDDEMKQYYINSGGDPSVFTNDLSRSQNGSTSWGKLGGLSEKYESGGNPGAVGYDSTGGLSYGTYQLAHSNAQKFVDQSPFKTAFAGLKFNSPQWVSKWKEVAQKAPQQFAAAQKEYIARTHFQPQVDKLAKSGINVAVLPKVVQDAIWSTAVQHGSNTDVISKALSKLPKNASPADMLKAIYLERWSGGQRFASSTPAVKKSVFNRFFGPQGELATALRSINTA